MAVKTQVESLEEQRAGVFISYSREDKDFVRFLDAALTKRNHRTWVDLEDIRPTEEWMAGVYSGIEGANAFAFVISPESVESKSCLQELAHAIEHNKRLIPIVRRQVDDEAVPEPLRSSQWIFFRDGDEFEESFRNLVDALDTDLHWVRAHTRLLTRAIEWDRSGRDPSFLLRGSDLRTAEEWQVGAANKVPGVTTLQTEYILAGRRDVTRRQRFRFIAVTFALIVAVVLGLVALWQRNVAENQREEAIKQRNEAVEQRNIALARQLAAQSQLTKSQHATLFERSVLLAVESNRRYPSVEADQALRSGLALLPRPIVHTSYADPVWEVAFSPNWKYMFTASGESGRVQEVATGEEVARMRVAHMWHVGYASPVAFSPDGKYVAIASEDDNVRVLELDTGQETARMIHRTTCVCFVLDIAFSPDGEYLATANEDKSARLWDVTSGEELVRITHADPVDSVAFSPDGKRLATASANGAARVWEVSTEEEIARVTHAEYVTNVAFSPDGAYLATASFDGTARVWLWRPQDLSEEACSRLSRNLTREEWRQYLEDEPYHKTCPNLPEPG